MLAWLCKRDHLLFAWLVYPHRSANSACTSCFRTLRSVVLSIFGRPSFTPWATARLRPALTCWRIMLRSNSAKDGGGDRPVQEILGDLQEPKTVGLQAAVEATRNLLPKLEADLKALTKAYNTKRKIGAR